MTGKPFFETRVLGPGMVAGGIHVLGHDSAPAGLRILFDPAARAVIVPDPQPNPHAAALATALTAFGKTMIGAVLRQSFPARTDEATIAAFLAEQSRLDGAVLAPLHRDIAASLHRLGYALDFSDGFNLEILSTAHNALAWHYDYAINGQPVTGFVRAVRCPDHSTTLLADPTQTTTMLVNDDAGRILTRHDVRAAFRGPAGLHVIKGPCVHATPEGSGTPRTIYTLTPLRLLPGD